MILGTNVLSLNEELDSKIMSINGYNVTCSLVLCISAKYSTDEAFSTLMHTNINYICLCEDKRRCWR